MPSLQQLPDNDNDCRSGIWYQSGTALFFLSDTTFAGKPALSNFFSINVQHQESAGSTREDADELARVIGEFLANRSQTPTE